MCIFQAALYKFVDMHKYIFERATAVVKRRIFMHTHIDTKRIVSASAFECVDRGNNPVRLSIILKFLSQKQVSQTKREAKNHALKPLISCHIPSHGYLGIRILQPRPALVALGQIVQDGEDARHPHEHHDGQYANQEQERVAKTPRPTSVCPCAAITVKNIANA